jgi:hypothetical protein
VKAASGPRRELWGLLLALVTLGCVGAAFLLRDTQFLMPGPLASSHRAIENCGACHSQSGSGKFTWIHGLVAGNPRADSEACLTCHKMPDTAFNPHGAPAAVLEQSTQRLTKVAAETSVPLSARVQSIAFPTSGMVARGLPCATCHQEHQGVNFNLSKISNEQCRSCHVVKFDSFDGHHPQFENYPFKRRTPIIYDHAGHFGKHFPEMAKKNPASIPATCSTCHNSQKDRRVMAVAPFEQTCAACHLDQVTGKERVSGPKGIAFLTLPGLDLQTLKKKKAKIGEWPEESETELTPFMKVMISRNERGRTLIKAVDGLNLQDLSGASDGQIKAVTNLVWEIKRLYYVLITGKASDVLAGLNIGGGAKPGTNLIADLAASIPRDVVTSAYQQWLPNLGTEMAGYTEAKLPAESDLASAAAPGRPAQENQQAAAGKGAPGAPPPARSVGEQPQAKAADPADDGEAASTAKPARPAPANPPAASKSAPTAAAPARSGAQAQPKGGDQTDDLLNPTEDELRGSAAPGKGAAKSSQAEGAVRQANILSARPATDTRASANTAQAEDIIGLINIANGTPGQDDDLLNPTEDELKGKGPDKPVRPAAAPPKTDAPNAKPEGAPGKPETANARPSSPVPAGAASGAAITKPPTRAAPAPSIESEVDPENWAEYGGWYRQDYTIFYRPADHKDKFIYAWLTLTGPQAPKGDTGPAAAIFDALTGKDAQGSCTKCHSVDEIQGKGRAVNFLQPSMGSKQGRFTNFIHEPHFGVLENRGCLTCHSLEKGRPYLQSYEQGNPQEFVSNFGVVKKDLCQTCHTSSLARQDCMLCHKYHVNGVVTPVMNTKVPTE